MASIVFLIATESPVIWLSIFETTAIPALSSAAELMRAPEDSRFTAVSTALSAVNKLSRPTRLPKFLFTEIKTHYSLYGVTT
jgi:hypothetical protein